MGRGGRARVGQVFNAYQLPFPPPFFLVLVGSVSAWPDLAK
jgi:hypothetical protein